MKPARQYNNTIDRKIDNTMTNIDALMGNSRNAATATWTQSTSPKYLELFKNTMPSIYNQYVNYQPQEQRWSFDHNNHRNLVNYPLDKNLSMRASRLNLLASG